MFKKNIIIIFLAIQFIYFHKTFAQEPEKDVSTLSRITSLFSIQLSGDYAIKGNTLVYENDIFSSINAKYEDYFLTFELYTPVIRWQRSFLPLAKTIKSNNVNINNSTYTNYSFQKFDMLGLINLQDFIYKKWGKKKEWLSKFSLYAPFYKQTIVNTENYYKKSNRITAIIGFAYEQSEELIASNFKYDSVDYSGGKYSINTTSFGIRVDEFYNSLQSYLIHKTNVFGVKKNEKRFVFIPTPAFSYYRFKNEIGYYDINKIELGKEKYNGTGFTAGIGSIIMYRNPNITLNTNFIYMPWHNESFINASNGVDIYRDYNNDFSFNIGLVCNPLFFLNKK